MSICSLCKVNESNQTGSHIIPFFIMKNIDNVNKSSDRSKEISFTISPEIMSSYFGASVLPENLEPIFGEITEEDISKNKSIIIEDYLLCRGCEKRFGVIESEVSRSLYNNNLEKKPYIFFLLWISILWRISVSKSHNFKMKSKDEKRLRRILNEYLVSDLHEFRLDKFRNDLSVNGLVYHIIKSEGYGIEQPTYFHINPSFTMPYSMVLDEFAIFIYMKESHVKSSIQSFFGLEQFLVEKNASSALNFNGFIEISNLQFGIGMEKLVRILSDSFHVHYNKFFDLIHQKIGGQGKHFPPELRQKVWQRIKNEEIEIGRRYSQERILRILYEVIKESGMVPIL